MSDAEPAQHLGGRSDTDVSEGAPMEPAVAKTDPTAVPAIWINSPELGDVHGVAIEENTIRNQEKP